MNKIYVLSLKNDIKRRESIKKILSSLGYEFKFMDAPDGRVNHIERSSLSKLTNTEAACSLGHIDIYKNFLNSDEEYAIILEDDISINKFNINLLESLVEKINCSMPAIYLLGGQEGIKSAKYFVGKNIFTLGGIKIFQSYKSSEYVYRTCCYIITKSAASNIISANAGLTFAADSWGEFRARKLIMEPYLVKPGLFVHPSDLSTSHIEASRGKKDKITALPIKILRILFRLTNYGIKLIACRFY